MELVPAARTAPPHCPATIAAAFKGNLRSPRFITFVITTTTVDTGLQKGDRLISTCKMLTKTSWKYTFTGEMRCKRVEARHVAGES